MAFNYRAACRARSHGEFAARIAIVAEESDESQGWLEFIEASERLADIEAAPLRQEAAELTAIFSASAGTARYGERNRHT